MQAPLRRQTGSRPERHQIVTGTGLNIRSQGSVEKLYREGAKYSKTNEPALNRIQHCYVGADRSAA